MTSDEFEAAEREVTDSLRVLPWEQRTERLEELIIQSALSLMVAIPDTVRGKLLLYLFGRYTGLVKQIDDGDIACLDHAAIVTTFIPSRAPAAAQWIRENNAQYELDDWCAEHQLLAAFNRITRRGQSVALH